MPARGVWGTDADAGTASVCGVPRQDSIKQSKKCSPREQGAIASANEWKRKDGPLEGVTHESIATRSELSQSPRSATVQAHDTLCCRSSVSDSGHELKYLRQWRTRARTDARVASRPNRRARFDASRISSRVTHVGRSSWTPACLPEWAALSGRPHTSPSETWLASSSSSPSALVVQYLCSSAHPKTGCILRLSQETTRAAAARTMDHHHHHLATRTDLRRLALRQARGRQREQAGESRIQPTLHGESSYSQLLAPSAFSPRRPQQCYGSQGARHATRRLTSSRMARPPQREEDGVEPIYNEPSPTASSPLSSAPSSPLVFPADEEDEGRQPANNLRHGPSSTTISPIASSPNTRSAASMIRSPPIMCQEKFDTGSPLAGLYAALQRQSGRDRQSSFLVAPTSPSFNSSAKRRRLEADVQSDVNADGVEQAPPIPPIEPSTLSAPLRERPQRCRRQSRRSPIELTRLNAQKHNATIAKPHCASSPTQPSLALRRQQQQKLADEQRQQRLSSSPVREATPPTSSLALNELLTASQARPDPPRDHPGRSQSHAKARMSDVPQYQRSDGNVIDLDAIFGDNAAVEIEEIRRNTLFIGGENENDDDEDDDDEEDDVVFELLKGRRRAKQQGKQPGANNLVSSGASPDEVSRFFTSANNRKPPGKNASRTTKSTSTAAAAVLDPSSPLSRYSARVQRPQQQFRTRTATQRQPYTLAPPNDLPATSSYARVKREEGSPTREIKRVKARRYAAREARMAAKVAAEKEEAEAERSEMAKLAAAEKAHRDSMSCGGKAAGGQTKGEVRRGRGGGEGRTTRAAALARGDRPTGSASSSSLRDSSATATVPLTRTTAQSSAYGPNSDLALMAHRIRRSFVQKGGEISQ